MDPEAVAALQAIKAPVGVFTLCGRARHGKSFLLNQLLGRTSGFQVASTHKPCTKGLWMWSTPLKATGVDGTEYNIVLLDTEGIDAYDQTCTRSMQIFMLAVLLSSTFVYNQMGGIDEASIDRLSLVTEMTKHIRVRASGGSSTASELGHFSPVFVWLLRDFYLDLAEDNRKITPRDYLELALRSVQGGARDVSAKNAIRESIRALFPDRECFTLVRPVNDEKDLQRLEKLAMSAIRPEFTSGLSAFAKFVLDRTKPKQLGATIMNGPILAGLTQSFLDAINTGTVLSISSSWQRVKETECRRAYESAVDIYNSSFDRKKMAEEDALREAHESAMIKAISAFNASSVDAGPVRSKFQNLLQTSLGKSFEDFKKNTFLEADLQCSNRIQSMESKVRAACNRPDSKLDDVVRLLDGLLTEYEATSYGSKKWAKLASFLHQCLSGPLLELAALARAEASAAHKDKVEAQREAMARVALIEKMEQQVENLEREKIRMVEEMEEVRWSEFSNVTALEHEKTCLHDRMVEELERVRRSEVSRVTELQQQNARMASEIEQVRRCEVSRVMELEREKDGMVEEIEQLRSKVRDLEQQKNRLLEILKMRKEVTKLTKAELLTDLIEHGFGAELKHHKNPKKKILEELYDMYVIGSIDS